MQADGLVMFNHGFLIGTDLLFYPKLFISKLTNQNTPSFSAQSLLELQLLGVNDVLDPADRRDIMQRLPNGQKQGIFTPVAMGLMLVGGFGQVDDQKWVDRGMKFVLLFVYLS